MRERDRCRVPGCPTRGSFGAPGSRPMFCRTHAPDGCVNLHAKPCIYPNCKGRASYRKISRDCRHTAEYCGIHAPDGYVNHAHRFCIVRGCNYVAEYRRDETRRATHCKLHAPKWYITTATRRRSREQMLDAQGASVLGTLDASRLDIAVLDSDPESTAEVTDIKRSPPIMKVEETEEIVSDAAQYLREIESDSMTFASF